MWKRKTKKEGLLNAIETSHLYTETKNHGQLNYKNTV
jgi:hypothetical protein